MIFPIIIVIWALIYELWFINSTISFGWPEMSLLKRIMISSFISIPFLTLIFAILMYKK